MNQPPLNPDALAQLIMWKKLPFGGRPDSFIQLDANAAYAVIKLLQPHLAAALPEVTNVEELDQLPLTSVVRTHNGWVYELRGFGWVATGLSDAVAHIDVLDFFPARVLYRPSEQP